ncbi:MAG: metallophosphoesterase [Terriglobales bacterium]
MRVLLISDVHANLEALEACLAAAPSFDVAINLGDIVGYGASPNEVIELARRECRLHVRGNHDKVCAGLTSAEGFNPVAAMAAHWTRQALTAENLEWLRGLPAGPLTLERIEDVQFVHGSPLDEDDYMIGVTDSVEPLLRTAARITFFGHSHLQGGFSLYNDYGSEIHTYIELGGGFDTSALALHPRARYMINPGSVGQPRDGDWRAGFAVFESDPLTVTFFRVPYDVKRAQQRILEAQLPERLASRLTIGR